MRDIGTVERVIRADWKVLVFQLTLMAGVLSLVFLNMPVSDRPYILVAVAILIPVLVYSLWPLLRAVITGSGAIIITDRGLLSAMGGIRFVAWKEITDARIRSQFGYKRIDLQVRNLEQVLSRLGPVRRWILENYLHKHGGSLSIYVSNADVSAQEMLDIIRSRCGAVRNAV